MLCTGAEGCILGVELITITGCEFPGLDGFFGAEVAFGFGAAKKSTEVIHEMTIKVI